MRELDAQVGVIGVGTMGSMALWQLARRGISAVGFEQFRVGHELGAGVGEGRQFRDEHLEHDVRDVMLHAEAAYRELEADSGMRLLSMTGGLTIGSPDAAIVRQLRERMIAAGDDPIVLDAAAMSVRYPQHALREGEVAVWSPRSGVVRPELSIAAATTSARAMGAHVVEHRAITAIEPHDDGVVLRSGDESWRVGHAIVTAGPWVWRLLPHGWVPGGDLGRLLLTWFPTIEPERFSLERHPTFTREVDGVVLYGLPSMWAGTARVGFAGPRSRFADPSELDRAHVPQDEIDRIELLVAELMPGLVPHVVRTGTHLDAYTPDGQPLIGTIGDAGRVSIAAAFCGRGFKMAPVIGRVLAEIASDGRSSIDVARWDPARFR